VDLGSDPVHGKRDQPDPVVGVEPAHGLHQADVALLDQVAQRQSIAGVAPGDMHHEAQVVQDQLARGIEILPVAQFARQTLFLVRVQDLDAADRCHVVVEVAYRDGHVHRLSHQCLAHEGVPPGKIGSILAVCRLEC
jgi:hypothetical protein